jgi:uncharacterized protein (TIGR02285 family)
VETSQVRGSLLSSLILASWLASGPLLPVHAQEHVQELTIAWRSKPPHQYVENGVEKGILLERARAVFQEAHLPTHFVEEPAKRIWHNFAIQTENYCSFGWYRIPERESLVQFSAIFHTDPPHTLLVAPEALAAVQKHKTLASLLDDPQLTRGMVDGVSYGPQLDAMIKHSRNHVELSSAAPLIMANMIANHRASFMLIDREDWEYMRDRENGAHNLVQLDLQGMPNGLSRYIVCSNDVSAETMKKINAAIAKVWQPHKD